MPEPDTDAGGIPVSDPTAVITYSPVVLHVPGRQVEELQVKVVAPETGTDLPVILLSHGHGSSNFLASLHGYAPLAEFWAAHGFVVLQPTHQDGKTVALPPNGPEGPLFWRSRAEDLRTVLDHLDDIEARVPGFAGRIDHDRIAAVGHSLGGHTVGLLLGQGATDPATGQAVDFTDARVKTGVMMVPPGDPKDLAQFAIDHFAVLRTTTFDRMKAPTLVVVGEKDLNPSFSDRVTWRGDAYRLSPSPKTLMTMLDAGHMLGGVSGFDAVETTDEDPQRVAVIRAMVWAYLRTQLYPGDSAWDDALAALAASDSPKATVESK